MAALDAAKAVRVRVRVSASVSVLVSVSNLCVPVPVPVCVCVCACFDAPRRAKVAALDGLTPVGLSPGQIFFPCGGPR